MESSEEQLSDIGQRVRAARDARGWSQARLAKEAGVSPNTVLSIENGKRPPRPGKLAAVLNTLGIAVEEEPDKLDLTGVQHDAQAYLRMLVKWFVIEDPAVVSAFVTDAWGRITDDFIKKVRKNDAAGV